MSQPSFSSIIPHYHIPDLLMRCVDSIPVRDDIQVIAVDDCSPEVDTYLLKYPAFKVKDVALKCGYVDQHYFSYSFKKETGMSPIQYKKQMNEEAAETDPE